MITRNGFANRLGMGAIALAVAATSVQAVDTLKLGLGIRETASTAAIGAASTPNTGQIEWVSGGLTTAKTLIADGTWQQFTFTFGTDPVASAFGVGNGTLSSSNMKGALEHLLVRNSTPTTSEISLFLDDIVLQVNNSVAGTALGTYSLTDFEAPAAGTNQYMFAHPAWSGTSTSAGTATSPSISRVVDGTTTAAHGGDKSLWLNFKYTSPSTSNYTRITTSNLAGAVPTGNLPNPTIDFASGNVLSFWAKATIAPPTMFWAATGGGDWYDTTKWSNYPAEPVPGTSATPKGDAARFLGAITSNATINLTLDTYINQVLFEKDGFSYTINSTPGGPGLIMSSTASPSTAGTATIASMKGTHNVNADLYLEANLNLVATAATDALNIGGTIDLLPTIINNPQLTINKQGAGPVTVGDLKYGYLNIETGAMTVSSGKVLNLITQASGTGTPAASPPQALFLRPGTTLNLTNTSPTLTYRFTNTTTSTVTDATASIYNDGTLNMSGGTLDTFRITVGLSTRGHLNLSNGAAVNVTKYLYGGNVSLANSSVTIGPGGGTGTSGGVTNIDDLTITGTGFYEVNNNDMVINNGATSPAQVAKIRGYLASGYAGGNWNGVGIRSSAANADANDATALGYATGAQLFGTSNGTISGFSITPTALAIKYTYYGDANLSGTVDADDYVRIDRGFALGLDDWFNGDFDYSGTIDSADYALIDRVFIQQGAALSPEFLAMRESQFGAAYVAQLVAAVPEPTGAGIIGLAGLAMAGKRRRKA